MEEKTTLISRLRNRSPFQLITISFLGVIFLGSLLLTLPFASSGPGSCPYLDALFTSTSAVCVTGLVVYNTGTYWTLFGKAVILALIQIGGLGVITVIVTISIFAGRRIGLRERNLMQNVVNAPKIGGIIRFTRFLFLFTFAAECAGAVLLFPVFGRRYGVLKGIGYSIFHSISAFCNAGFDIISENEAFSSLSAYSSDVLLNIVIMLLIIVGGLGFFTWSDLVEKKFHWKRLLLQTKLIITVTAVLIIVPAVIFFLLAFADYGLKERTLLSLFQSVTARTAGFCTIDPGELSESARMLLSGLMMIGGSPASTAGGMKTTTAAVIVLSSVSYVRQRKNINTYNRSIAEGTIQAAYTLLVLYLTLCFAGSIAICAIEKQPMVNCIFECASALGTVGLTASLTPKLGAVSKGILIFFMYAGRVGGLTLAYAAFSSRKTETGKMPEENVMVG